MQEDLDRIMKLSNKIENEVASLSDYKEYESLLVKRGLPKENIKSILNKGGFHNWKEFSDRMKNNRIEAAIIGALAGLGLGILLASLIKK